MISKFVVMIIMLIFSFTILTGCATTQGGGISGCAKGAAIGGLGGGLVGALVAKNKGLGILIGGVVGALGGCVVGDYMEKQVYNREQAMQQYHLSEKTVAKNGYAKIVETKIIADKKEIDTAAMYSVIDSDPAAKVSVTERRYVVLEGEKMLLDEKTSEREQGSWATSKTLKAPADVQTFAIITEIEAKHIGSDQRKDIVKM